MSPGFRGPRHELAGLRELIRIYRRVRPDLVHHVTPKSVIFGTLAARMTRVPRIVNAMTSASCSPPGACWRT
ncbi:MAG: hypothetical protein IPH09_10800 [bacterium]|nr:hypothetical protein [bacterium]